MTEAGIPKHLNPRSGPGRAYIPPFLRPETKKAQEARLANLAALGELTTCPAITKVSDYFFDLSLPFTKRMSPVLEEIQDKEYRHASRSWRFKVDAAPKLLAHLPLIRDVYEDTMPYRSEDPRSEKAKAEAEDLLENAWWLLRKGDRKFLGQIAAKDVLNTAEVKLIRALATRSEERRVAIDEELERKYEDDLVSSPERFNPERIEDLKQATRLMANLDPDRAKEANGEGFNSSDTDRGHFLARADEWRLSYAYAAYRMLKKYHGQIEPELYGRIYA